MLVEAAFAFRCLKASLNGPVRTGHPAQMSQGALLRIERRLEGELVRPGDLAPDQDALLPAKCGGGPLGQPSPVTWALDAIPGAEPLPRRAGKSSRRSASGFSSRCWALITASP